MDIQRLRCDEAGISIILMTIVSIVVVALIAIAIDGGLLMIRRTQLEHIIDAAAVRGAQEFYFELDDHGTELSPETVRERTEAAAATAVRLNFSDPELQTNILNSLQIGVSSAEDGGIQVSVTAVVPQRLFFAPAVFENPQHMYMTVTSAALSGIPPKDFPNLLLAVDTSCSMWYEDASSPSGGDEPVTRIVNAVAALHTLVDIAPEGTVFGLITFDAGSRLRFPPEALDEPISGEVRTRAKEAISLMLVEHNRCETHMPDAIIQMQGLLLSASSPYRNPDTGEFDAILPVLITDGEPTSPGYNRGPLQHPLFTDPEKLKSYIDGIGSIDDEGIVGPCDMPQISESDQGLTLLRKLISLGRVQTFAAAQTLRMTTNLPLHAVGFGLINSGNQLLTSATNAEIDSDAERIRLACRLQPNGRWGNTIGRQPSGAEGSFHRGGGDFLEPLEELIAEQVQKKQPRRISFRSSESPQ